MKIQHIIAPTVLAFALTTGIALAQTTNTATVGGVTYVSTPVTTSVSSGSSVPLGTFTISSAAPTSLTTIPLVFSAGGGGQLSNLSNCLVSGPDGTVQSTPFAPQPGVNSVTLHNSASISSVSSTFSLRCNVTAVPSGATFMVTAGPASTGTTGTTTSTATTTTTTTTTTTGTTGTVVAPLIVNLDTAPTVPAGSLDAALANISLGGGANAARITAIPLTITPGNGASLANLTGCYIRSAVTTGSGGALSNQFTLVSGGTTNFTLGSPLTIAANGALMLSLACNVQPGTPVGSSFTISINPATIVATDLNGTPITVGAATGVGPNDLPASTSGVVTVTAVVGTGTGSTGGTTAGTGTPSVPNTGAGGTAGSVLFVLALAALAALAGAAYLRYERAALE